MDNLVRALELLGELNHKVKRVSGQRLLHELREIVVESIEVHEKEKKVFSDMDAWLESRLVGLQQDWQEKADDAKSMIVRGVYHRCVNDTNTLLDEFGRTFLTMERESWENTSPEPASD